MDTERRQLVDRRRMPTRPLSRHSLSGRRRGSRRQGEDSNYYVDRYEPRYLILISLILALCALDAYFTLKFIEFGGRELSRFTLVFMSENPVSALVLKYLVIAVSIIFILVHKNFRVFGKLKVYALIYLVFFVYLSVIVFEAAVFFNHIKAPY